MAEDAPQPTRPPWQAVGVISSKGGAGKSTVAANLALALADRGLRVGLLDADLDSPYLAEVSGVKTDIGIDSERRFVPVDWMGLKLLSFGLTGPGAALGASMRGSTHETWLRDAVHHTDWSGVDVIVIDMPSGTSDEVLALRDALAGRFLGYVVVALPNIVSGLHRVWNVCRHHALPILGAIENMSGPVFGEGPIHAACQRLGLPFYGSIPLDVRVVKANESQTVRLPQDLSIPVHVAAASIQARLHAGPLEVQAR